MSVLDFFTKTATKQSLSSTSKTVRTFGSDVSIAVSEPQPQTEMDLIQGIYVTKYSIYTAINSDIKQQDKLSIDSNIYHVLEVKPHQVRNIEFKQLTCVRD